ncbi:hypothetical protein [Rhizobium sp. Rhizsp82]|uniref:hypothetical protein n=1 Tax=Rhizobium sp. Rhizsp82 TaxID=3243057 RepID=UPI0039B56811
MNIRPNSLIQDFSSSEPMVDFLSRGPLGPDTWLFVYDAWMVRPLIDAPVRHPALVRGWRRSVLTALKTGGKELPLTLISNGSTHGALILLTNPQIEFVWDYWLHDKLYRPVWVNASSFGKKVRAMTFVTPRRIVDRSAIGYLLRDDPEISTVKAAAIVAHDINAALREMDVSDLYLIRLERELRAAANNTGHHNQARLRSEV